MIRVGQNNLATREAWLKQALLDIKAGESIIDVGAGETKYKKFCSHLNYKSQDFGNYDGQGDLCGLQMEKWDNSKLDIVSDIKNIPVFDGFFDNTMCIEVLEHVPDPIGAIKEMGRITKSGGRLIVSAPFCSLTHFSPYFFCTGFSKYWYEMAFSEAGFNIVSISFNGNFFEYLAQELGRLPDVARKYSKFKFMDKIFYKLIYFSLLFLLNKLSVNNKKSEEILCYGLQVVAIKK